LADAVDSLLPADPIADHLATLTASDRELLARLCGLAEFDDELVHGIFGDRALPVFGLLDTPGIVREADGVLTAYRVHPMVRDALLEDMAAARATIAETRRAAAEYYLERAAQAPWPGRSRLALRALYYLALVEPSAVADNLIELSRDAFRGGKLEFVFRACRVVREAPSPAPRATAAADLLEEVARRIMAGDASAWAASSAPALPAALDAFADAVEQDQYRPHHGGAAVDDTSAWLTGLARGLVAVPPEFVVARPISSPAPRSSRWFTDVLWGTGRVLAVGGVALAVVALLVFVVVSVNRFSSHSIPGAPPNPTLGAPPDPTPTAVPFPTLGAPAPGPPDCRGATTAIAVTSPTAVDVTVCQAPATGTTYWVLLRVTNNGTVSDYVSQSLPATTGTTPDITVIPAPLSSVFASANCDKCVSGWEFKVLVVTAGGAASAQLATQDANTPLTAGTVAYQIVNERQL
jgi:hypothetical protein